MMWYTKMRVTWVRELPIRWTEYNLSFRQPVNYAVYPRNIPEIFSILRDYSKFSFNMEQNKVEWNIFPIRINCNNFKK
jgi:hypothetical protein